MIKLTRQSNAIIVEFSDNDKYLFNGKIEVALNELMLVLDTSNMATFKRASNGDTLFSQLISEIRIAGESVTKENIAEKFAAIAYSTSGGGAVESVNGQTGAVVITADSIGAISKQTADETYQPILTQGTGIKIEGDTISTVGKVVSSSFLPQATGFMLSTFSVDNEGEPSIINAELSGVKDNDIVFEPDNSNPLTPITYIKLSDNIVRKTVADETYATKQELTGKLDTATYNSEKASFETKENAAATYQVKGDYATKSELPKLVTLTQAEYDGLATKDENTYYFIKEV